MNFTCRKSASLIVLTLALMPLPQAFGQDLEPRRWTPLPPGLNVVGAGYVRTEGDVFFNPVLLIENAEVGGHTAAISYVRSFAIAGKLARLDLVVPWQNLKWSGLLDGAPAARFLQRISTLIERPVALTSIDYGTK